ncbi:3-oxoadipate enol-lactonase [Kribbella antiqua]|uniref:3-oxoadipate enol-lactonase n=1 Tax=Kribbella antiqua TaxID=2512217 RepID=A0A4R2IZ78_9ACTN|nr:alpha/beta fold hydrolase [Kribbella antiqua]TCO50292.1 3-oxoadipate enol-lactonase [Kribbella antiqua]
MVELAATRLAGQEGDLLVVGPSLGTSVEALWGECAVLLGDEFEVVGWDLPGHGRSRPASAAFTLDELASAVRDLALEAAGDRHVWYAGVSVGGAVALQLALDPGPFGAVAGLATAAKIGDAQAWQERADLVRRAGTAVMVAGSAERWFAPGFTDRRPEIAGALLTSLVDADASSYAYTCEALAGYDLGEMMGEAKVPLLVAAGEHDPVVTAEQAAVPGAAVVLLTGCGHLPAAEDPRAVASLLRTFFRGAR